MQPSVEPIVCMFCKSLFDMVNMVNLSAFILYRTLSAMRCLCFYCGTIEILFFPLFPSSFQRRSSSLSNVSRFFFSLVGARSSLIYRIRIPKPFGIIYSIFFSFYFAFGKRLCLMTHIIIIEYGEWVGMKMNEEKSVWWISKQSNEWLQKEIQMNLCFFGLWFEFYIFKL